MTSEQEVNPETDSAVTSLGRFEELDYFAKCLKSDAKMLGGIFALSSITYTVLSGFGGLSPAMSTVFHLSRIPLWALIVGPLITIAAVGIVYHLCKMVDQKTAEAKTSYRNHLEVIAAHTDLMVDDSGPEPFLRKAL